MLVLARKRNEAIQIGDNIVVKVIQCGRGTVRIGIEAPDHVRVLRTELLPERPGHLPSSQPLHPPTAMPSCAAEIGRAKAEFGRLARLCKADKSHEGRL